MSDEEDELILSELDDDELVQQMFDDLYDGLKDEIEEGVNILLERGWAPYKILTEALVGGMTVVGKDFRDGILFVPEVLLAANAMKGGMFILKPLLAETGAPRMGKMVIGTVKGDIHDIGKNLVSMMMEGAGFEVVDIGINNPVENYLEALETEQPDILGMSALLTTTMPYMKVVIDTMVEQGLRDDYIVLVGGAPLNEEFGRAIGADAYCRDAAVAVETAKDWWPQAQPGRRHAPERAADVPRRGRAPAGGRVNDELPSDTALTARAIAAGTGGRVLLLACGALAREIVAIKRREWLDHMDLTCLPASCTTTPNASRPRSRAWSAKTAPITTHLRGLRRLRHRRPACPRLRRDWVWRCCRRAALLQPSSRATPPSPPATRRRRST